MSDTNSSLTQRLDDLKKLRQEVGEIRKTAFMAAPPMPQGGGQPPMDPAMAQQAGPPVDPATGMPMDPAMMQQGMPPQAAPPMDPAAAAGAPPQGGGITPEMLDELLGVVEELAAGQEELGAAVKQLGQQNQELQAELEDVRQSAQPVPAAGGPEFGM